MSLVRDLRIMAAQTIGLGVGIGEIYFVVSAKNSTDAYYSYLREKYVPEGKIYATVKEAYDAAVTDRNDLILKMPGLETVAAELNWEKNRTHLVGLGGPQQKGYESGTGLTCSTIDVNTIIHNTGTNNQFHNITLMNQGADAHNVSAFRNAGYGTRMIGCQIIGCAAATQMATALNCSLAFAAGGYYFYAENCNFGSTDFGTLGANTACVINWEAQAMVSDGKFVRCNIGAAIDATTRVLLYVSSNGIDRDWIFDTCEFYAFSTNHGYAMAQVVTNQDAVPSTYDMGFKNCMTMSITAFRTATNGCTWACGGGVEDHKMGIGYVTAAS